MNPTVSHTNAADQPPQAHIDEPNQSRDRLRRLTQIVTPRLLLLAIAITCTQVALATLSGRGDTWSERYHSLWTFDGGWYADIIEHGYRSVSPPGAGAQYNAAFFPGYPVAAGFVARLSGLSTGIALLVTAQLAALIFWFAVLRMLRRWQVSASVSLAVVILIFCQPGAFYLVVTYSESLFLASLVLLLSFAPRVNKSWVFLVAAAAAGYAMSATRVVGAPLAVLPALLAWRDFQPVLKMPLSAQRLVAVVWRPALVAIATAFGTISFFIFCFFRFGHWNEYTRARDVGWFGTHADFSSLFALERFRIFVPRFHDGFLSHADVTRLYVPVLTLLLVSVVVADSLLSRRRRIGAFAERVPFYVAAGVLFFLSATNANPVNFSSPGFIRYGLYTVVLLVLATAHAYHHSPHGGRELPLPVQAGVFLAASIGLALQLQFCWGYARGVFLA